MRRCVASVIIRSEQLEFFRGVEKTPGKTEQILFNYPVVL